MSKLEDKINVALICLGFGIVGTLAAIGYGSSPIVHEARVFQREEGKPAVMRTYKKGKDGILVQDMKKDGIYIPLDEYLNNIPNKADRQIEEATIKKVIEWYK